MKNLGLMSKTYVFRFNNMFRILADGGRNFLPGKRSHQVLIPIFHNIAHKNEVKKEIRNPIKKKKLKDPRDIDNIRDQFSLFPLHKSSGSAPKSVDFAILLQNKTLKKTKFPVHCTKLHTSKSYKHLKTCNLMERQNLRVVKITT